VRALRVVDRVLPVDETDLAVSRRDVEILLGIESEIAHRVAPDGNNVLRERFGMARSHPAENAKLDRHYRPGVVGEAGGAEVVARTLLTTNHAALTMSTAKSAMAISRPVLRRAGE